MSNFVVAGPKIRILRNILTHLDASDLVSFLESNPSFLAYSKERFTRLSFESESRKLDCSCVRKTLQADRGLASWLSRTGCSTEIFGDWLATRLTALRNTIQSDGALGTDLPRRLKTGLGASWSVKELQMLEKKHGRMLSEIELVMLRQSFEVDLKSLE